MNLTNQLRTEITILGAITEAGGREYDPRGLYDCNPPILHAHYAELARRGLLCEVNGVAGWWWEITDAGRDWFAKHEHLTR